jgi:hypothetical protein
MSKIVYSSEEDSTRWHDDVEEALLELYCDSEEFKYNVEYQVTVYSGEEKTPRITDYLPSMLGLAMESARECCDGFQITPFDCSKEQEMELKCLINTIVEKYCEENSIVAGFSFVDNVRSVKVKFLLTEDGVKLIDNKVADSVQTLVYKAES